MVIFLREVYFTFDGYLLFTSVTAYIKRESGFEET